jgi:hypothetical protein
MELSRHGLLGLSEFPHRVLQLPSEDTFNGHRLNFFANTFFI